MRPVVVFCTASLLQCGVGVGSAFRRSHWEADLLRTSASPENYYEISVFTLTLAGERNITQSSTFLRLAKLHAGFRESSMHRYHTKEVWGNGDSRGFVPRKVPLSF